MDISWEVQGLVRFPVTALARCMFVKYPKKNFDVEKLLNLKGSKQERTGGKLATFILLTL